MDLELRAPCKINLLLNILGRRPDGFHALETILHPVPVFDRLQLAATGSRIELTCNQPLLSTDTSNLVHRAAAAFFEAAAIRPGVRIHLEKQVPLAAGLGGGSSDAAATLAGLNRLFGLPLPADNLSALAARLGSDVPFFLQQGPALGTGRGDCIEPLDWFPALRGVWAVLVHPGFGVATAWAYRSLARFPEALNGTPGRARRLLAKLQEGDLQGAAAEFYNSLEAPVLTKYPILAIYQDFLRAGGAVATLMSGSGSTTFALAREEATAASLSERFLAKFGKGCWTAAVSLDSHAFADSAA